MSTPPSGGLTGVRNRNEGGFLARGEDFIPRGVVADMAPKRLRKEIRCKPF